MNTIKLALMTGLAFTAISSVPAWAQSLPEVLAQTYEYNHGLNATRAQLRASEETLTQARSAMRPQIRATTSTNASRFGLSAGDRLRPIGDRSATINGKIKISQILFDGFRTTNDVRSAKAKVLAARADLENDVQATLLDAATLYASVVRNRKVADLRRKNLDFLLELVSASNVRFRVGEGTRTDVAQAEAQQALATALLNASLAEVAQSEASFLQIVGDLPGGLGTPTPPAGKLLPASVKAAVAIAAADHPAILAGKYAVEAQEFAVAFNEGDLLPRVTADGSLEDAYSLDNRRRSGKEDGFSDLPGVGNPAVRTQNEISGSLSMEIEIPIYQGGLASSRVRESKETLGQRRIEADRLRSQVRSNVEQRWAELQAARGNVKGFRQQLSAARVALGGVIEERAVGQRTTLNVLEAQAEVISAEIRLANAERDVVSGSYGLLYAIGRNSPERLRLDVSADRPVGHGKAADGRWGGQRTPDGR